MNARRVAWLLVAAVAVIAFAIWLSSLRHLERATLSGDPVLPGLEHGVNTVTEVRLRRADDTHATLKKEASEWMVAERGWPAELSKVRKLLLDLGTLDVVEEKTRLPANYAQLGVEDVTTPKATGTRVEVVSPARSWALIVGKPSSAKSGYVRVANSEQSLLAAPALSVDADPKAWLQRSLLDLPAERVREIEQRPLDVAPYGAARQKKEDANFTVTPLPKGRELSSAGAADVLATALSGLTLEDVAKSAAEPQAQASHAIYRTFDGLEVEVTGRKDGARALIMLSAHSTAPGTAEEAQRLQDRLGGWEFEIPDYKYAAIFTPISDLLKPLPEPAKKAAKPAKPAKP